MTRNIAILLHMGQVWKHRAAPLLWEHLATQVDSVDTYTLLYHEAALTTLLEVLFHDIMQHDTGLTGTRAQQTAGFLDVGEWC